MRKDGRAQAQAMYEGKRITKYGKTKTEAKQKLDAYLADLRSGKVVLGPKQTVEQYLTHWLENVHRLGIELTSLSRYRGILRTHLIPAFGHLQLSQLTKDHVQAFHAEKLRGGYAPATIRMIHNLLSCALDDAVADGLLARNVCDNVTLPKQRQHKPHVLNKEQASRLVAAARGHRLWFLILMGLATGARLGELLALHWSDFDMHGLRILIRRSVAWIAGMGHVEKEPKTSHGVRKVVLTRVVMDAIQEQKEYIGQVKNSAIHWDDLDLVFPNKNGRHLRKNQVGEEFHAIISEAGLPAETTMHDLRHSFATLLFAAGVNPKVIQEALGHSNISVTLGMYGDVLPDMQDGIGGIMDDFLGGE
jgi:integrase